MIKLADNRTSLINLGVTIKALEDIDQLIKEYNTDSPGPAYVNFEYVIDYGSLLHTHQVQFDRSVMVTALKAQRKILADHLATLGIEA